MKVLHSWSLEVVCDNCGVKLEIDVNDLKVKLVGNCGQTGDLRLHEIPEYSIKCRSCKSKVYVQKNKLPFQIQETAEKNSNVDLSKVGRDLQ